MRLLFGVILTVMLFSCTEDEMINYDSCIQRTCTIKVSNECLNALNDLSYILNDGYTLKMPDSYEKLSFYFTIKEKEKTIYFKQRQGTFMGNRLHLYIMKLDQLIENNIKLDTL